MKKKKLEKTRNSARGSAPEGRPLAQICRAPAVAGCRISHVLVNFGNRCTPVFAYAPRCELVIEIPGIEECVAVSINGKWFYAKK
jgi:hypothetical protein